MPVAFESEQDRSQIRFMAIALIQDGIGQLDPETEAALARFESDGMEWREYVIFRLNGMPLPVDFIRLAIRNRWNTCGHDDRASFTSQILGEWHLLDSAD